MSFLQRQAIRDVLSGDGLSARLIRGGIGSTVIQVANRVFTLVLGIVLARTLGTEGYGIYAYAFAIMSLLMVVAEAGVPTLLMREVAANQGREEWGLLRGALRRGGQLVALTAIAVALVGLLVLWTVGDRLSPDMFYTMALVLLVLPLSAGTKTVAQALMGLHRVVFGLGMNMLLQPLLVVTFVGGAFLVWPALRQPQYAMAAQLLAAAIVLVVGLLILRRLTPPEARTAPPAYRSREWLRSALPFMLIGGAGIINSNTDIIMLGWFTGPEEVGIYRVAVQGATLVAFSLQVANAVVAPQFSRLYAQGDMARLQRLVTQSAQVVLFAALPVTLVFILAGAWIISWVFGAEFAAADAPLAILAVGYLLNATFGAVGALLQMTGYQAVTARILWQIVLLNIVLNAALIPPFGLVGAAVATSSCLPMWHFLLYRVAQKRLGISSLPIPIRHRTV